MKKWLYSILVCLVLLSPYYFKPKEVVHICVWYDFLPDTIVDKFEKETGIKVIHDLFDGNDMLETKLLTDNPGYDVVTPTAIPYLNRGIELGLYEKLNPLFLPNINQISPVLAAKTKHLFDYGIPYGFGTFGIFYNKQVVEKFFPVVDSYALLFEVDNVKQLAPYGIALNDDFTDIVTSVMDAYDLKDTEEAYKLLAKIRPYIKYFNIARHANDMSLQEIVISLTPNHEAMRAVLSSKKGLFAFVIPSSEKTLYCDMLAIPKNAPHRENAYRFINFLLRPDIAATLTNETLLPNSVSFQHPQLVNEEIRNNPQLFLPSLEKYKLHATKTLAEYREMSSKWVQIIMGRG